MFARIVGVTFPRRSFASIPGPVASGVEPQASPCGTGRCWCDHAEQIGRKLTEMGAAQSSLRVRVLRTVGFRNSVEFDFGPQRCLLLVLAARTFAQVM